MSQNKRTGKNKKNNDIEKPKIPPSNYNCNNLNVPPTNYPFFVQPILAHPQINLPNPFSRHDGCGLDFPHPLKVPSTDPNAQYPMQKVCLFCKKEPSFSCHRCGGYYCSQECQKNDWQNHRFTCFSMPPLVPIKGTTRTVPPISPLPKNQSRVRLTGFRRSNLCYVRSMEPRSDEQFSKGNTMINNYGASAQLMTELPSSNTYAIAFYKEFYHRVQVLSASSSDSIRVLFIDIGIVRTLKLKELRKIYESIVKILQHAVAIKLKGVENYIMNLEIEEFLNQFSGRDFILEYKEDEEVKEFILRENCYRSLNDLIVSFADTQTNLGIYEDINIIKNYEKKPAKQEKFENKNEKKEKLSKGGIGKIAPILSPPFELIQFNESDHDFVIVVLNDSDIADGLFGCIARSNKKFIDIIASYFKTYVDDRIAYEPELYEYCLANIDEKWCRVQILSSYKNIYTVINVDTTVESKIKRDQIRRYPDDFKVPCATVSCKVDGLRPTSSNKLVENFIKRRFTVNSQHRVNNVTRIKNGIRHVQMDDLIDELILDFQFDLK